VLAKGQNKGHNSQLVSMVQLEDTCQAVWHNTYTYKFCIKYCLSICWANPDALISSSLSVFFYTDPDYVHVICPLNVWMFKEAWKSSPGKIKSITRKIPKPETEFLQNAGTFIPDYVASSLKTVTFHILHCENLKYHKDKNLIWKVCQCLKNMEVRGLSNKLFQK
jgi:hypothetical protein